MKKPISIESFTILLVVLLGFSAISCNGQVNQSNNNDDMETLIKLPEPKTKGSVSLEQALATRRSIRSYSPEALTLKEAAQILWAAYGVTKPNNRFYGGGYKTAPSAGATFPLEIYLIAGDVKGIEPGIYHYLPKEHALNPEFKGDVRTELTAAALNQQMLTDAPATIAFSAVYERTTDRYGERGNRYVYMDIGHSGQNVYLQCTAMGFGTVAIGAFTDEDMKKALRLPNSEEPLYLMPFGKIK